MATITGFFGVYSDGSAARVDAHGNNIAFACVTCGHPVLAVARENQRGSTERNPAKCPGCEEKFLIEVRETTEKVIIYRASEI